MVSSFSSKSEVALNLSTDRRFVTFMGYLSPIDALDVSNSNTPGVIDPTNQVNEANYRVIAEVDRRGEFRFTETNAYSGNNGRAAILNNTNGANVLYTAGNAGNGSGIPTHRGDHWRRRANPYAANVAAQRPESSGLPMPVGSFSITQFGTDGG